MSYEQSKYTILVTGVDTSTSVLTSIDVLVHGKNSVGLLE